MKLTQAEKAAHFQALHQGPGAFVIVNPWDAGSARVLAGLGFQALATSSAASAAVHGLRDGQLTRTQAFGHVREIVTVTELPVVADLENGFGDSPETVAETIRLAAETGLVGGSIEDATKKSDKPLYDLNLAVERIEAAVKMARTFPFKFMVTARAENFAQINPNLEDTIKRLQAYERAGADVLFAPGLPSLEAVRLVCSSVSKPVNFMIGQKGKSFSVAELGAAGVRRISLASALYRATVDGLLEAAREIKEKGTFEFTGRIVSSPELYGLMQI